MVTQTDLIPLLYTPDLTLAGIAYACRSLPHTYDRMGGSGFSRLRRIVSGKAVELAFRRCLVAESIPFDNLGATPFTDPDRYDIAIGGRRCDIKSFQFFKKDQVRRIHREPGYLLQAEALVPIDQLASSHLTDEDLYIFAFLTALITSQPQEVERALVAGQPTYFIHPLPDSWARPEQRSSLGRLALKSEGEDAVHLELGGQGSSLEFLTESISLKPKRRTEAQTDFFTLAYLHSRQLPKARLGIHSPSSGQTYIIQPEEWENIWVYGMQVFLAGYMTRGEFRRKARRLPEGSRVLQYARTRTSNWAVSAGELHSLGDLFNRAKSWAKQP